MGKRLRSQRRGKGSVWQSPSHRYSVPVDYPKVREVGGVVVDLFHDPGHGCPIARVRLENGRVVNMLATEGLQVEQEVRFGPNVIPRPGDVTILREIPEGTAVFNIEHQPGDGGQFVRAAGASARRRMTRRVPRPMR